MWIDEWTAWATEKINGDPLMMRTIGYWMLSSAVRGELRLSWGSVSTNLWVLVIGESSVTHKSVAMKMGKLLLFDVLPGLGLPNQWSPEGLLTELAGRSGPLGCRGYMVIDEVGGLFNDLTKKSYHADTSDMLCSLYDGESSTRRLRNAVYPLKEPYVTLLCATTPSRFLATATLQDMESGLLSRFLPIHAEKRAKKPTGRWTEDDDKKRNNLIERLIRMSLLELKWSIDDDALYEFNQIVEGRLQNSLTTRLNIVQLKLAMLHHVQGENPTGVLTVDDIDAEYNFVEELRRKIEPIYAQLHDVSPLATVKHIIKQYGPLTYRQVLSYAQLRYDQADKLLTTLVMSGAIIKQEDEKYVFEDQEGVGGGISEEGKAGEGSPKELQPEEHGEVQAEPLLRQARPSVEKVLPGEGVLLHPDRPGRGKGKGRPPHPAKGGGGGDGGADGKGSGKDAGRDPVQEPGREQIPVPDLQGKKARGQVRVVPRKKGSRKVETSTALLEDWDEEAHRL